MKFSEQWLREWVNPKINTKELASHLTMAGLEVDAVTPVANVFENVVIGEVIEIKPHPDADRLKVCKVNVGEAEPLTIVCGATNVRVGMKAPVALIGAVLSPTLEIKKAKLRGVESFGMLCSMTELGMTEKSEGLLDLPADAPVGTDIRKYLDLDDNILDLKITPNRGDCLSIAGIAREVAVIEKCQLTHPAFKTISAISKEVFPIKISAQKECPRYVGRIIRNIHINSLTPIWMQERLRRSGIRSINPIVDVGNYVMLELGQPMHIFDLQKLDNGIEARLAKPGEKMVLLNEQEVELDAKTLVIADAKKLLAIAGVMGGSSSGVSENTRDIFLESAFFNPLTIAHAVQHYTLQSDSSQRFERGVDPELQIKAIERATELILAIAGGEPAVISDVTNKNYLPVTKAVFLRRARIPRLLGITIADDIVENIFKNLNMKVIPKAEGWEITPPSYRFDIAIEEDLIEELARIYGYDNIPAHQPTAELKTKKIPETEIRLADIRNLLIDRGYTEAFSYSFIAPHWQKLLDPNQPAKALKNPISQDMSVMRTNLWPGLLQAVHYNQNRQEERIRLFETGVCFIERDGEFLQLPKLGAVITGSVYPEQWGATKNSIDFFDVKSDVEALLKLTGRGDKFSFKSNGHPALHPNKSAQIYLGNKLIGYLGELHPNLQQELEVEGQIFLFEVDLSSITNKLLIKFKPVSKFPAVRRDLAIILDQNISIEQIKEKIINSANELLKNIQLFDIYQGKNIEVNKKSVAWALIFQHPMRTLTDDEINEQMQIIIKALEKQFHAKLRE